MRTVPLPEANAITTQDIGNDLYRRMAADDYGNEDRKALMLEVWTPTPWMIDVYEGYDDEGRSRERSIRNWCNHNMGRESSPIHGDHGIWHRGNVTMHGWTWYGFRSEQLMKWFQEVWPSPDKPKTEGR
jgi:hypothetical protein